MRTLLDIIVNTFRINPFSKKLIYISEISTSKLCRVRIFDVEEEKCFEQKILLRIITSLEGISQINMNNCLYLCGSNDEASNSVGSYLLKIDISISPLQPIILINSIFSHNFPSLINYLNDYLIVVGGKNQIQCECYQLSNTKWKQLPTLPDDRYKATLFCDEQNDNIYLFGGYNSSGKCNSKSILRLNMKTCSIWELIVVKENENFLARNSSICFMFEGTDKIFICGGKDNNDKDTEYIIEYDSNRKTIKKIEKSLKKVSNFEEQGYVDLNKLHFAFFDKDNFVHTISRNSFRMSIIKFDDFCQISSNP